MWTMIRLVKMGSNRWYGKEIDLDAWETENIETFVYAGEPVILCSDLQDIAELLDINGVQMVDDEEKAVAFLEGQGVGPPSGLIQSAAEGRLPGVRKVGPQEDEENELS